MLVLMLLLVPLVFLGMALAQLIGQPGTAEVTPQKALSYVWRAVRYLWRERTARSGAARAERPPLRYRPPRGGGR